MALSSVAQQLRRLADVSWLCPIIDPSDHEVLFQKYWFKCTGSEILVQKYSTRSTGSAFSSRKHLEMVSHLSAFHLSVCSQGPLTDFSKRSRSAKFRLVPKFKKDKNNKNKETCATLSLPGELCHFLSLSVSLPVSLCLTSCLCRTSCLSVSLPVGVSVHQWGTDEVGAWLDFLCLTEYKDIFIRHDVRGAELIHLERRDLKVPRLARCAESLLRGLTMF